MSEIGDRMLAPGRSQPATLLAGPARALRIERDVLERIEESDS